MSKLIPIVVLVLAAVFGETFSHNVLPMAEKNLASVILKSSRSMENNSQRNIECFATYLPKINEATNNYEMEYSQCLVTAANATAAVETEVTVDRTNVRTDADGICTAFQECSQKDASVDFFQCYYDSAEETITKSYGIQTLAKDRLQYIEMKYQTIAYAQNTCTDICSEAYVRETSLLYAQLEACLAGLEFQPETTTAAYTTESTTTTAANPEPVPSSK